MYQISKKYRALYTENRYFIISGGRGSGKSFAVADFILRLTFEANHVILFTRYTMTSAHISIIPEFIDKIEKLNAAEFFDITQSEIINKQTGSKIIFRGIKVGSLIQTAALKSIPNLTTWIIDEAEELPNEQIFDTIDESIRSLNAHNRVLFVLNPPKVTHWIIQKFFVAKEIKTGFCGTLGNTVYIHTTYQDNKKNLSNSFLEKAEQVRMNNYQAYKHRYLGYPLTESAGALWKLQNIKYKVPSDTLKQVYISLDPAVTTSKNSDETGIVIVGKDDNNIGYVIADHSGKYTPLEWASLALKLYESYKADAIIAEVNQGGDMVKTIIKNLNNNVRILTVHATRGKALRAEPIAALYEEGKVFHVKHLPLLEEQMLTWDSTSEKSPDRIDAMVHGLTKIMLTKTVFAQ